MTHEEVKILLNDYFDEKLSIEVNTEIQVHLSECSDCSQYLFSLQDLMKKADQLPRNIKPPTDFWHDIFTFISSIKAETIKQQEEIDLKEAAKVSEESSEEKKTNTLNNEDFSYGRNEFPNNHPNAITNSELHVFN